MEESKTCNPIGARNNSSPRAAMILEALIADDADRAVRDVVETTASVGFDRSWLAGYKRSSTDVDGTER